MGPGDVNREDFFDIMSGKLKQHPDASDVFVIGDAYVLSRAVRSQICSHSNYEIWRCGLRSLVFPYCSLPFALAIGLNYLSVLITGL